MKTHKFEDISTPDGGVNVAVWYRNQDLALRKIVYALEIISKQYTKKGVRR
jgi:hypothetical protein